MNEFGGVAGTIKFEIPELDEVDEDIVNAEELEEEKDHEEDVSYIIKVLVGSRGRVRTTTY